MINTNFYTDLCSATEYLIECKRQRTDCAMTWNPLQIQITHEKLSDPNKKLESWENFFDFVNSKLQNNHKYLYIKNLSPEEHQNLKKTTDFCYRMYQKLKKEHPENEKIKNLKYKAYAAKLGGKIDPRAFENTKLLRFVEANRLFHGYSEMQNQLEVWSNPKDPVLTTIDSSGKKESVKWSQLKEVYNEKEKKRIFYNLYGKIAFETSKNYQLTENYTLTDEGIHFHNVHQGKTLLTQKHRPPRESKFEHQVEICNVMMDNKKGSWNGMHTWLEFTDHKGHVISGGGWGPPRSNFSWVDAVSPLGKKQGQRKSPDDYSFFPKDITNFFKATGKITAEQHKKFCDLILEDQKNPNISFSFLKDNCLSWASDKIFEATGHRIKTKMPLTHYSFRMLPEHIQANCKTIKQVCYNSMPKPVQKAIEIATLPIYYIYSVAIGLLVKLFSLLNHQGISGSDITLKQIFTMDCAVDHPVVMREYFKQIAPNGVLDLTGK